METKGKEYEPILILSQFGQRLARCLPTLLLFQNPQKIDFPSSLTVKLGPGDCFLNKGM